MNDHDAVYEANDPISSSDELSSEETMENDLRQIDVRF